MSTQSGKPKPAGTRLSEVHDKPDKEEENQVLAPSEDKERAESRVNADDHRVMMKSMSGNINNLEELVGVIDNRLKLLASKQKSLALNLSDMQVQQSKVEKKLTK